MSEAHSPKPIRVESGGFIIEGTPKQTKKAFFKEMEKRVRVLDGASYQEEVGPLHPLACFEITAGQTPKGKQIEHAVVLVNEDGFILDGEDFTDLIPITVRHEIAELWAYAKTGYSLLPLPKGIDTEKQEALAHGLALREEYRYAFEISKADRHHRFMKKHTEKLDLLPRFKKELLEEREEVYQKAKARHQRKSRNI